MRKGDFVKIEGQGIGKVEYVYDDEDMTINICEVKYYRNSSDTDFQPATEKEYIEFIKTMVKELTAKSTSKRKEAADYNKKVDGSATKNKGKVSVINGDYYGGLVENAISSHHRGLLTDAKKAKELKDILKKEIAHYKEMEKYKKAIEKALKAV
jgi:hypothetical protein